jgi:SAM-dependent methyltransferase
VELNGATIEDRCRSCGGSDLTLVISLGETPLANSLLGADQLAGDEKRFPLDLVFCNDCALAQISVTVPPAELFSQYLYLSSFSETMLAHASQLVERLIRERKLGPQSLVAEIASNDGYLLQNYVAAGVPSFGIEPAQNIAEVARSRGVPTVAEFFGLALAEQLAADGRSADIIHAHNVLAHVADLNGVVAGMAALLKPGGIVVVEAPYVGDLIEKTEFDTIYHEHLCYFSLSALAELFARHGLGIEHVERLPIHGGSLRIFASHQGLGDQSVEELLEAEGRSGMRSIGYYSQFADRVRRLREDLRQELERLRPEGRIAAYGASAKGSTLLNYIGVGSETLDFIVDRSTVKQGLFTPGTRLPILAPDQLLERMPAYVLLLVWNFADEVLRQQKEYRDAGGRFIIPVPTVKIV